MKRTGAQLLAHALEQLPVPFTFGIPGTHTTEIYDELNQSEHVRPILVAHEGGGSFMADAISRSGRGIGVLTIVPAAGTTHAMSGIGEAFVDGIPMLVITGGTRTDSGRHYQLHQVPQTDIISGLTKAQYLLDDHSTVIRTVYAAYEEAMSGCPGPVFLEMPVNTMMFAAEVDELPPYEPRDLKPTFDQEEVRRIADLLCTAEAPMLYVGWGSLGGQEYTVRIAEALGAPVAVTLQGKSAFPNSHPLFTSVGIGASSKPSGQWALKRHDALLAVGVRFSEISTGSYGLDQPKNLVHVDIDPNVFHKNYRAEIALEADAADFLEALWIEIDARNHQAPHRVEVEETLQKMNRDYFDDWLTAPKSDIVSPGHFFRSLRAQLDDDAILVTDDGKHTFLASELFPVEHPRQFISPTDFNCMGYCVPAAIATKLANPQKQVAAIVGDGAMLMTGLELITAAAYEVAPILFIFNDGELGQISQFQQIPLNRKTCTVLSNVNFEGIALTAGIDYLTIDHDGEIEERIAEAIKRSGEGTAVLINVRIDYSKRTMLTKGVVKTNLGRFPLGEKLRFLGRAAKRHVFG